MPEGLPCCTTWTLSHNPAHISQMFDVVYLHSCLRCCSPGDTASGPVSDVHVYLWACFSPLPSESLSSSLPSSFFYLLDFFSSPFLPLSLVLKNFGTDLKLLSCSLSFPVCLFSALAFVERSHWRPCLAPELYWDQADHGSTKRSQTDTETLCFLCACTQAQTHTQKDTPSQTYGHILQGQGCAHICGNEKRLCSFI